MNTFDPMAAAIDWLDAYREGSLSIVNLYASDAALECGCGGLKMICGWAAIAGYWRQRFSETPAGELIELQPNGEGITVCYRVPEGAVQAALYFDLDGKITRSVCGPTAGVWLPS